MPNTIEENNIVADEMIPATDSATSMDKVMEALQAKVLGEGGVVSSEDTGFEKAIAGIKEAGVATGERIESEAEREIGFATTQANVRRTQALEGRTGFGTQKVALKLLEESNIKYIGDLQRQKEDAMLANDVETARQVAGLQVEAMRYEQQSKQNYFNNLLGVAGMAYQQEALRTQTDFQTQQLQLQRTQEARLGQAQTFAEQQAMGGIALQFGIQVEDGDTFEDVINRAKPFASAQQKAQLDLINAQIRETNASVARIRQETTDIATSSDIEAYAQAARFNPAFLGSISNKPEVLSKVLNQISKLEATDVEEVVLGDIAGGGTLVETLEAIDLNPNIQDKATAKKKATELFGKITPAQASRQVIEIQKAIGLKGFAQEVGALGVNIISGTYDFFASPETRLPQVKVTK